MWGLLDLASHAAGAIQPPSGGPTSGSGGEATAQRWYCWKLAGKYGSSGIPNPAGEQNCHLVNHKTIFVLARRTLSLWKMQTVFNTSTGYVPKFFCNSDVGSLEHITPEKQG